MKKKYTKKQILESIKYWKKQLNEATKSEIEVANNIKRILDEKYKNRFSSNQIKIIYHPYYGPQSIKGDEANIPVKIYCSGVKNTSDIYVVLQNGNDIKEIGIEVKSNSGSMFNPQLNYAIGSISYTNDQFHDLFYTSRADAITQQCQNEFGKFVRKMLNNTRSQIKDNLNIILNTPVFKSNNISIIPFNLPAKQRNTFFSQLINQLKGVYPQDLLNKSKGLKRIFLAFDTINDNDIIKAYFNTLRTYPDSAYKPVQYIQYDGNLYCIDNNCDFFTNSASFNVSKYDNDFTGVRLNWFLDFTNKPSDNKVRIKGYIKAFVKNDASLDDVNRLPNVNDGGFFN